jgi:mono/diheme cytochrome c family protein
MSSVVLLLAACPYVAAGVAAAARAPAGAQAAAAAVKNPVDKTPESIAAGKRIYLRLCQRCHGPEGKGDGGGGGVPSDLTDDTWDHGSSDGEIFKSIHDGTSADMEGYGERISDTDIWNVVNFVRSLGPPPK